MAQAATATVKTLKRQEIPFAWEGRDKKGNKVKGNSLAPDENALRADLRRHHQRVRRRGKRCPWGLNEPR